MNLPTIDELRTVADEDVVKRWLMIRGLVAVDRKLIDIFVADVGEKHGAVYDQSLDRYIRRARAA